MVSRAEWLLGELSPAIGAVTDEASGGTQLFRGSWVDFVDLPLWALAAVFAFRIAASFRGGALGRAAGWVGWALVVVASGKALRAALLLVHGDRAFSSELAQLAWGAVLAAAWGLAGMGIYEFYRAGRSI